MIRSYLLLGLRNFRKHLVHMGLSVLGLAAGIACFALITVWVHGELRFDRFHENADRIYRAGLHVPSGTSQRWAQALYPHAELLTSEMPEVVSAVRVQPDRQALLASDDVRDYEERVFYTEPSFFDIFDFEILRGHARALSRPNAVFLTPSAASKYFGDANPVGQTLQLNNETELDVVGIVAEPPYPSHLRFDFLISLPTTEPGYAHVGRWNRIAFTYLLLRRKGDLESLQAKLPAFEERYVTPHMSEGSTLSLISLPRIHLFGNFERDVQAQGDYRYVLLFSAVAFLVLLIACVNYVTLVTARSADRAGEVGIRKAVGANRTQLVGQFIGEAVVFTTIAVAIAVGMIAALHPAVERVLARPLPIFFDLPLLLTIASTLILVILVCGGYPAWVLSRLTPTGIFKGILPSTGKPRVRRALVVFQFAVSIALIGGSLIILRQLSFVQEKRLGFDKENVLVIDTRGGLDEQAGTLKAELLRQSAVDQVSLAYAAPARPFATAAVSSDDAEGLQLPEGDYVIVDISWADFDFVETLGLEIINGRDFSAERQTDLGAALINETARDAFGWNEPLGKQVRGSTVIGVVRDFHITSLREPVRPTLLQIDPNASNRLLVRLHPGWSPASLDEIAKTWASMVPSIPFDYTFLDQEFDAMYRAERRIGRILGLFTLLAVLLACLGLFGVSAYIVQRRTKEIGIRKVLGASTLSVIQLLSREFVVIVAMAAVVGCAIAYVGTSQWLEGFAYRASIGLVTMMAAAGIALVLALAAVGSQAWRAARMNPAESLRYE